MEATLPDKRPVFRPRRLVVRARDRMSMTLFLAIAFHIIVIAGVSFSFLDRKPASEPMLDLTLVDSQTDEAPKQANYRAQANQKGGGNTRKRIRQSSPVNIASRQPQRGKQLNTRRAERRATHSRHERLLTARDSSTVVSSAESRRTLSRQRRTSMAEIMRRSRQIARLTARSDQAWRAYSQKPDPKFLHASSKRFADTEYLLAFTRKVERLGNLNYPDAARRKGLSGSLLLEVTLAPSGRLRGIAVLESSGHRELDQAAIRIVRLAAPFPRIPKAVLQGKNELRIVNTWQFSTDNRLTGR